MPGLLLVEPREVGPRDPWGPALERGLAKGLDDAGELVRAEAESSLAGRADPWGNAYDPLSPTTLRIYALVGQEVGGLGQALAVRARRGEHKVTLRVVGPPRRYAYIQQFGNPNNLVFGEGHGPIPPRPFLPIRNDNSVDLPAPVASAVLEAVRAGIREALQRERR